MRTDRLRRGFTLLEVTAALLVTSLLILAVASSLAAMSNAWERFGRRGETQATTRLISRRLGLELGRVELGPFGMTYDFAGQRDNCSFLAAGPDGPRLFSLKLQENRLLLCETIPRRPEAGGDEIVLAEQVAGLDLAYYDGRTKLWLDRWPGSAQAGPPVLLRLKLALGDALKPQNLPPIILPIYAGRASSEVAYGG